VAHAQRRAAAEGVVVERSVAREKPGKLELPN